MDKILSKSRIYQAFNEDEKREARDELTKLLKFDIQTSYDLVVNEKVELLAERPELAYILDLLNIDTRNMEKHYMEITVPNLIYDERHYIDEHLHPFYERIALDACTTCDHRCTSLRDALLASHIGCIRYFHNIGERVSRDPWYSAKFAADGMLKCLQYSCEFLGFNNDAYLAAIVNDNFDCFIYLYRKDPVFYLLIDADQVDEKYFNYINTHDITKSVEILKSAMRRGVKIDYNIYKSAEGEVLEFLQDYLKEESEEYDRLIEDEEYGLMDER